MDSPPGAARPAAGALPRIRVHNPGAPKHQRRHPRPLTTSPVPRAGSSTPGAATSRSSRDRTPAADGIESPHQCDSKTPVGSGWPRLHPPSVGAPNHRLPVVGHGPGLLGWPGCSSSPQPCAGSRRFDPGNP